jgi:SAM-dependent methyltransferase
MEFSAGAERYDRWMGRYSKNLAPAFADASGIAPGMRVVDVGCGPGSLASELATRVGEENVAAIDPAEQFVEACRSRLPGADVRQGGAEELPWPDDSFDAAVCSLVIAFMKDPAQGLSEMIRVTRPGGVVSACMWDLSRGGGMTMLCTFWDVAHELDSAVKDESGLPGVTEGEIGERLRQAGLRDVVEGVVEAQVDYPDFSAFWEPFTFGIGPAGQYLASVSDEHQARLREGCRLRLPDGGPFTLTARAWCARGIVQ